MIPVIALVGRPNVGKSTLFNRLTKTRDALVADVAGLTRDRQYGEGRLGERPYIVIDTGGLVDQTEELTSLTQAQSIQAIREADCVFFMVDARAGLNPADETIATLLRQLSKQVVIVVNKVDGLDESLAMLDFYALGFGEAHPISASHGRGVTKLIEEALQRFPELDPSEVIAQAPGIRLAVIGRPNVGKSTLINRMLGEERVVVFDSPGTTRDSIMINLERKDKQYTLIDTAGVRRRGRVKEVIEKFSVIKTLQAIEMAHVAIVLIDAQEGVTDQDLHLIGFVLEAGKGLCIVINKWDGLSDDKREQVKKECQRRLDFADFAPLHFISALHGSGVGDLFTSVNKIYSSATKKLTTPELTRVLEKAIEDHQPPLVGGRRIKLRYAHSGGHNPPLIVIHGNQTDRLPGSYKKYLMNTFRAVFKLFGTPIRLEFKSSENPYKDQRQRLTPRQEHSRTRKAKINKKKK